MKSIHGWCVPDADTYVSRKLGDQIAQYQRKDLLAAVSYVKSRKLAIDIGGHIGTSAIFLASLFDKVISFEPAQDTFECLVENVRHFKATNVECQNVALAQSAGRASLVSYPRDPGNVGARFIGEGDTVKVERLDDFGLIDVDFVKIDVEGAESLVLLGAEATLLQSRPVIMFEVRGLAGRLGPAIPTPQEQLASWGATCLLQMSGDEIWGWDNRGLAPGG